MRQRLKMTTPWNDLVDERIREIIADALRKTSGNVSQAARDLGVPRRSLWWRIRKLEIDVETFRPGITSVGE